MTAHVINGQPAIEVGTDEANYLLERWEALRGVELWRPHPDPNDEEEESDLVGMMGNDEDVTDEQGPFLLTGASAYYTAPDTTCGECSHGPRWHSHVSGCTKMVSGWCPCERVYSPLSNDEGDWVSAERALHDAHHLAESDLECDICRELIPSVREADEAREAAGITDRSIDPFAPTTMGETIVTIRVLLPLRSTTTSFSIDTESDERRDALVAFLLAHGITDFATEAPPLCLSCGKTEGEHGAWCEDMEDTFIAGEYPITPEVN